MSANVSILPGGISRSSKGRWSQQILLKHLARLKFGGLQVRFDDGGECLLEGEQPGPRAQIAVHRPAALVRALVLGGDLGFAEAYMRGDWSSRDLGSLLYLLSVNLEAFAATERRSLPVRLFSRVRHALRRNSRSGSRRNIAAHYDLGNDFYARWLDRSMSYSSAVYDRSFDLEQAQLRKYQLILDSLDAEPGAQILEIGCGWGGFAEYAARRGMFVTGVTLSQEQYDYAARRIEQAGLRGQVDLRLADYRTLQGEYDHVVSIEMFEAVGQAYWSSYFEVVNRCLRPGGRVALQVITIREDLFESYRRDAGGFIQRYIFPGGMLPTEKHLRDLSWAVGLETLALERYGEHYADTLADWADAFNAQTGWLEDNGYDQRFRRMWRYYLAFCEAGFRDGRIDLVQHVLQKA